MQYTWNGERLGAVMALPAAVADDELKMAGDTQLKVILWFARNGQFDPETCAAAVGKTTADCADAMRYWEERGLVRAEGAADTLPPVSAAKETPPEKPVLPPPPVRPDFPAVVARQKSSPDFDYLLKTAEQRLGRAITPGEMETFLYIYDVIGLPAEVILMILVNAVQNNKVKARSAFRTYLEKVAISWKEQGIVTIAAAEEELCRQERRSAVREHIRTLFSLDRAPTLLQVETATRWIDEWQMSDELLCVALAKCREKTGTVNFNYIARIVESWYADGITTTEQALAAATPSRKKSGSPLLSDEATTPQTDDYEQAVAQWRPVYKKKDR